MRNRGANRENLPRIQPERDLTTSLGKYNRIDNRAALVGVALSAAPASARFPPTWGQCAHRMAPPPWMLTNPRAIQGQSPHPDLLIL
jgi:hypothetical protein